jgi:2-octaprenyl-6-methoxyphenol hydroxylase
MGEKEIDVAIVGAGPVGCALALALKGSGLGVRLVGRAAELASGHAIRPLALSYASRLILERIGAWDGLVTTSIEQIHVSQSGGFGRTKLARQDLDLPALGYVADYADVARHLAGRIEAAGLESAATQVPDAPLVVHAEGMPAGQTSGKDYGHTAIVGRIECERPPAGIAWERFTSQGPLALLPLGSGYGLVWSRIAAAAPALMDMSDSQFLAELQAAFGWRAGRFRTVGPRSALPLALRYRTPRAMTGEIYVGNAAQTLHPVAGQGLNLGLRDAWDLASLLRTVPREELPSRALASRFASLRRIDSRATIAATDLLATLYVRRDPLSALLRGAALTALDVFPPARRTFARRMIYGASAW